MNLDFRLCEHGRKPTHRDVGQKVTILHQKVYKKSISEYIHYEGELRYVGYAWIKVRDRWGNNFSYHMTDTGRGRIMWGTLRLLH
jgi:hypothetical protein